MTETVKQSSKKSTKTAGTDADEAKTATVAEVVPATTKSSNGGAALTLSIIALVFATGAGAYCVYDYYKDNNNTATPISYTSPSNDGNSATFSSGSVAEIASKVSPAVVSIQTTIETTSFFGQTSTATAGGTGMIVTGDGYIVTNKHVIEDAVSVEITTADGQTYNDVKFVAEDPTNDVAFLKINNVRDLPTVTLGDSKSISVGQQVLVIGNALGAYQNSVTSGIISGIGRSVTATNSDYSSVESLSDMIQTDAAINAGNSGGPLVNAAGEVIGINTATSTSAEAIGFAIPISSIKGMLNQIVATGHCTRAYLGVYYTMITPSNATQLGLSVTSGAYVHSGNNGNGNSFKNNNSSAVISGGPADTAGIRDGDIITAINGTKVTQGFGLGTLIGEYRPGDRIEVTILRDGSEQNLILTLGEYKN